MHIARGNALQQPIKQTMVPLPLLHSNTRTSNMRYSEIQDAALCREDSWFLEKEGACTLLGSLHVRGTRIQTTGNRRRCVAFSYRTFSASHWQLHTPFTERHLQII